MRVRRRLIDEGTVDQETIDRKTVFGKLIAEKTISGKLRPCVEAAAPLYLGRTKLGTD
jgi:hypothetical protein